MGSRNKVVTSSLLLVATRFLQRLLGLISTLILARLLIPEDFGIVAIAAIVLQFTELLANSGIKQYIPQKDQIDDEDLNTAWSIDVCFKGGLWLLLMLLAPLAGAFYEKPEIVDALRVVSVVLLLRALQNPGLHLLRRNLTYRGIFWLSVWQKAISFVVVIGLALATRSYWAMIVGDIVFAVVGLVGSYKMHSFRPSFSLRRFSEQWSFSKWLLVTGIVGFVRAQADQLIASKIFGIPGLGAYNVVRGIAVLPATEVIVPSAEPLLASYARVKHNLGYLGHQLRVTLLLVTALILPACLFLASYPHDIVLVLLGSKWIEHAQLMANLTILLLTFAIGGILGQFYVALGRVKMVFVYNVISTTFIVGLLVTFPGESLAEFALNRGLLGAVSTGLWLTLALVMSGSSLLRVLGILAPVIGAAFLSIWLVRTFGVAGLPSYIELAANGCMFAGLYAAILVAAYFVGCRWLREWGHLRDLLIGALPGSAGRMEKLG